MKKRNVIKSTNLRAKSPIITGLVFYLALDKWNAPEWAWGAVGFLYLLLLIAFIKDIFNTVEVDLFEKEISENKKKSYNDRVQEMKDKQNKL